MSEILINLKQLHPAQKQILREAKRYNVLKCGRRFGKTELTKELAINPMLDGFPVGYFCPTYKDLHEVWNELKTTLYPITKSKDEQVKQITLITGGKIDMWSMDDPNSGRGRKYKRVIIDEAEKARHFKEAWEQTIQATVLDYSGDAWFMSTPKFGQTYFKEIALNKEKYDDWMSWVFTTYDNPYMDKAEIEKIRNQLDNLTFRCEYMAEDVNISLNPFAYAYDDLKHIGKCSYNPSKEVMLSFDFNVDPITAVTAQYYDGIIHFIKEFRLPNSDIYALCDTIKAYFPNSLFMVTGDSTGQNRSALTKGNLNYYTIIQQRLQLSNNQMKQPTINPAVSDSRILMNSLLQNMPMKFDPDNCPYLIKDLKYVEVGGEGDIIKDRSTETRKADLLDAARYLLNTFFDWFIKASQ